MFTAFSIDIMRSMIFSLSSKSFNRAVSRVSRPDLLSWKYRSARKTSKKFYWWEIFWGLRYWGGVGWGEEILGKGWERYLFFDGVEFAILGVDVVVEGLFHEL